MEGETMDVGVGAGGVVGEGGDDGLAAIPHDARIVKALLKSMGVEQYEPRVIHQFLELWYRYVVDVLSDAQVYSEHASKMNIDADDVKIAIQSRLSSSFSQPPPRELLMELARSRNSIPLPKSLSVAGIPIPPEEDTLISPNYQLFIPKHQVAPHPEEEEEEDDVAVPTTTQYDQQQPFQQPMVQQKVSFPLSGTKRPRQIED